MAQKILVIDDNQSLRKAVMKVLAQEGFAPVEASDGSEGLLMAAESAPDLVLTDAEMPGLGGHDLCRTIKKSAALSRVPVIIMSGEMVEEKDVVAGLDGGADDYLIKPFTMKVLISRIRAVLRRFGPSPEVEKCLQARGISLDASSREARVAGKKVLLTRKEFDLLALFIEKAGRVLTSSYLLETIWGYDLADYNDPHTVESHVSRLRTKLGRDAARWLVNVRGVGYKFEK
jgi:DNA-binding response OmpR family regulator